MFNESSNTSARPNSKKPTVILSGITGRGTQGLEKGISMNRPAAVALSFVLAATVVLSLLPTPGTAVQRRGGRGDVAATPSQPIRRMADGKPDISGFYQNDGGGANYGLERRPKADFLTPPTRGVVVDPPDGMLPYQPWARAERVDRELPHRGYDDPTAHCLVPGIP